MAETKTTAKATTAKATTTKATAAKTTAKASLPKEVFGVKVNTQVVFDTIMAERAAQRQGTHKVKTRGEVSGGGKRPWAQKGTGNARQGSIRSPQWVGGGVVWGPTPEKNYVLKVNKKVRRLAFASALTLKAKEDAVLVHDFKIGDKPNTKELLTQIAGLKLKDTFKKLIIVTEDAMVWKSASNLPKIFATKFTALTIEAIVNADAIIFEKATMKRLEGQGK